MQSASLAYADQTIAKREALLRQLQLHAHAYIREEGIKGSRVASTNTWQSAGRGLPPTGRTQDATHPRNAVVSSPKENASDATVKKIAQQLRRETIRAVEAIQLVQIAHPDARVEGSTGGSSGHSLSAVLMGVPQSREGRTAEGKRFVESLGGSPGSKTPGKDTSKYTEYLRKMLSDTDIVMASDRMVCVSRSAA
jgi:hypothetical protein